MNGPQSDFVRATSTFLSRFPDPRSWPKRRLVASFCRSTSDSRLSPTGSFERAYAELKKGRPISRRYASAFMAYFVAKRHWSDLEFDQTFEASDPPLNTSAQEGVFINAHSVRSAFTAKFDDHDEMYCHTPKRDIPLAAGMILRCFGRLLDPSTAGDTARSFKIGLEANPWDSLDDFERWLAEIQAKVYRSVMFAVARKKKDWVRAGVTVTLPLTESAYERFASGEVGWSGLMPDHICVPSTFVLICSVADEEACGLSVLKSTATQAHCLMYQIAYLTRGISPYSPAVMTCSTNPRYASRLHRFGFRDIGVKMHGSAFPIMSIRDPSESGRMALPILDSYFALTSTLALFQATNRNSWDKEVND